VRAPLIITNRKPENVPMSICIRIWEESPLIDRLEGLKSTRLMANKVITKDIAILILAFTASNAKNGATMKKEDIRAKGNRNK